MGGDPAQLLKAIQPPVGHVCQGEFLQSTQSPRGQPAPASQIDSLFEVPDSTSSVLRKAPEYLQRLALDLGELLTGSQASGRLGQLPGLRRIATSQFNVGIHRVDSGTHAGV